MSRAAAALAGLTLALALSPGARAPAQEGGAGAAAQDSRVRPLLLLDGAPYVELELGGARGWFLLDTGANASGVDQGWLERSGARWAPGGKGRVGGTTGSVAVEKAVFERFGLGTGSFAPATWIVHDYSGFRAPPGTAQAGLLGTDFLRSYQLTIDYEARQARFLRQDERAPAREDQAPLALSWINGHPTVSARLGRLDLPCRLDSGASYLSRGPFLDVNRAAVAALRAAGAALEPAGHLTVRGISGPERRELLRAGTLELGPLRLEGLTLVVHERGALAVDGPLALASASVLARARVLVLDPFDHLVWVGRPSERH